MFCNDVVRGIRERWRRVRLLVPAPLPEPGRAEVQRVFLRAGDAPARRTDPGRLIVILAFVAVVFGPSVASADRESGRWTLFFQQLVTNPQMASDTQGHIEFVVTQDPAAVNATGPLTIEGTNIAKSVGTFTIRGSVEDGVLTFVPSSSLFIHL